MLSVHEAIAIVLADVPTTGTEMVAVPAATGRVLAEDVTSLRDVPPFVNSAMDGYAARSTDLGTLPVLLQVVETIAAGTVPCHTIETGRAARIMTGAVVPAGADTVVKVEDTAEIGDRVEIRVAPAKGSNIRYPGEDVRSGELVLRPGRELRPADIGVLASVGRSVVRVRRRPRVAIVATGDELVELGQPLRPGQIVNSNAYTLAAAVYEAGGVADVIGIVSDDESASRSAFEQALCADIVLSTGGVSMGVYDLVRSTLRGLGVVERFWKVAQKPGKPLTFGRRDGTLVFGLPGNPVSALVCFYVYALPVLRRMHGLERVHLPCVDAWADEDVRATGGLTDFIRCVFDTDSGTCRVRTTGSQSSGVLRSMSMGHGLMVVGPERSSVTQGEAVRVIRLTEAMTTTPGF